MDEEWGPWQAHDGGRCPFKPGQVGKFRCRSGLERVWTNGAMTFKKDGTDSRFSPGSKRVSIWAWAERTEPMWFDAMEWCLKKPKGLQILENLLENLPAPSRELVTVP